jgi:hypothetical protein
MARVCRVPDAEQRDLDLDQLYGIANLDLSRLHHELWWWTNHRNIECNGGGSPEWSDFDRNHKRCNIRNISINLD